MKIGVQSSEAATRKIGLATIDKNLFVIKDNSIIKLN